MSQNKKTGIKVTTASVKSFGELARATRIAEQQLRQMAAAPDKLSREQREQITGAVGSKGWDYFVTRCHNI